MPFGAIGFERLPEGVRRSSEEALALAQRLLAARLPFHAHEVLEDAWKFAGESERELWRGLAQLAVGVTHAARGNSIGAVALLRRGAEGISPYQANPLHSVDVAGLTQWALAAAADLEHGGGESAVPVPQLTLPTRRSDHGCG